MGNLTVLGGLIIKLFVVVLPLIFLLLVIRNKKSKTRLVIFSCLFLLASINTFYFFKSSDDGKKKVAKEMAGYYKLDELNDSACENCKLNLSPDYKFDVIQNGKITGHGKWSIDFDAESAGYYLVIDGGPNGIIDDSRREIEFLTYPVKYGEDN